MMDMVDNRFAAVEISPPVFKSKAVTYVLTGGVIAAFLGPTSATYTVNIFEEDYVASFMAMALIGIVNQVAVSFVNFPSTEELRTSLAVAVCTLLKAITILIKYCNDRSNTI